MSPRTQTAPPELSRATIVERALAVMDVEGPDAVTIRRIAAEFAVTPMALYWHVENKDELFEAMGDALLENVEPPSPDGPWSTQLRAVVQLLVDALGRHPAAAELIYPRILVCENGLRLTEFTLSLLGEAGFTVEQSADLARTALHTAVMLVSQLPGAEPQVPAAERAARIEQKRQQVALLPGDRYPHTIAAADVLSQCSDPDTYFAFGIDVFVEGAQALLRRQKRAHAV